MGYCGSKERLFDFISLTLQRNACSGTEMHSRALICRIGKCLFLSLFDQKKSETQDRRGKTIVSLLFAPQYKNQTNLYDEI